MGGKKSPSPGDIAIPPFFAVNNATVSRQTFGFLWTLWFLPRDFSADGRGRRGGGAPVFRASGLVDVLRMKKKETHIVYENTPSFLSDSLISGMHIYIYMYKILI